METWLVPTIWTLFASVFVWAICRAAARPAPQPSGANAEERKFTRAEIGHSLLPALRSFACLLLAGLLWAGCASSHDYPGPVHGLTFNGTVQFIDLQNHRLTLTPLKAGEPTVFVWEDSTKFWEKGNPIRPESIETNWPVRVHYHDAAGQLIAHHVYVELTYPVVH